MPAEKSLFLAHLVMVASTYKEVKKILLEMEPLIFPIDLSCAQLCSLKNIKWKTTKKQPPDQHPAVERFACIFKTIQFISNLLARTLAMVPVMNLSAQLALIIAQTLAMVLVMNLSALSQLSAQLVLIIAQTLAMGVILHWIHSTPCRTMTPCTCRTTPFQRNNRSKVVTMIKMGIRTKDSNFPSPHLKTPSLGGKSVPRSNPSEPCHNKGR